MTQLSRRVPRPLHPRFRKPPQNFPEEIEDSAVTSGGDDDAQATPKRLNNTRKVKPASKPIVATPSISDESENERLDAGIKPTTFAPKSGSQKRKEPEPYQGAAGKKKVPNAKQKSVTSNGAKRKKVNSNDLGTRSERSPKSSQRKGTTKTPNSSGGHMIDEFGRPKRRKVGATYGSKTNSGSFYQQQFQNVRGSYSQPESVSPKKATTSFIKHDPENDPSPHKSCQKFIKTRHSPVVSPVKGAPAKFKTGDTDPLPLTPEKKREQFKKSYDSRLPLSSSKASESAPTAECRMNEPKVAFQKWADDDLPFSSQNKVVDAGDGTEDLFSDIESVSGDGLKSSPANNRDEDTDEVAPKSAFCPWCAEPVDAQLLKDFSKGLTRLNVRQQTKFCQKHRKHTAMEKYHSKNYPKVNWEKLPKRLATYDDFLLDIVKGRASYFRTKLAEKIEAGKGRSLKKEDNLNPGYYGPRGFNVMCEVLVDRFGDLLKEKAVKDRVISGRGSAAFIQSVLVAELGVRLIMDDMGVDEKEARVIMEESKGLGEFVHEEA